MAWLSTAGLDVAYWNAHALCAMIAYTTLQSQQSLKKKRLLLCTTASNGALQTSVWVRSTEIGEWWGRT